MRTIIATSLLLLAVTSAARADAPSEVAFPPGSANVPIVAAAGNAFGIGTIRIPFIAWLPDTSPLMQALRVKSIEGRGTLVVFAALGDTKYYAFHGGPNVRATLAGITTNEREQTSSWFIADQTSALRPFLATGENAVYLVRNVPEPTADHPLTRVDFIGSSDRYQGGSLDVSGYDFDGRRSGIDPREDRSLVPGGGLLQSDATPQIPTAAKP